MPESEALDPAAVYARSVAAMARSEELAEQVSSIAAALAATEQEAAEVHERIAASKNIEMTPEARPPPRPKPTRPAASLPTNRPNTSAGPHPLSLIGRI